MQKTPCKDCGERDAPANQWNGICDGCHIDNQAAEIAALREALDEARDSMLCAISAGAVFAPFWGWLEDGVEDIKKALEAGR